jgi:uncharacterized protein (DUF983 family)
MVDDRRRFTPRADARGVVVVVLAGVLVVAAGVSVVALVRLAMWLTGIAG